MDNSLVPSLVGRSRILPQSPPGHFEKGLPFPWDVLYAYPIDLGAISGHRPAAGPQMQFCFERFALDTTRRELRRGAVLQPVEPQVFDLLEHLVRNRDRVVSAAELFQVVWKNRIVSDSALSTRINAARAVIDDNGLEQRLIRTLRTKGFRFVGMVREEQPPSGAVARQAVQPGLLGRPVILILPFVNAGSRRCDEFAAGITEELIVALSKANWLSVSPHSAVLGEMRAPPADFAQSHRARYVLRGTVREAADRVRVSAQLMDSITGQALWAERYEQDGVHVFSALDDMTDTILSAVEPHIYFAEERRARQHSPEALGAWECTVHALSLMNSRKKLQVATARRLLQRACALDPQSARSASLLSIVSTLSVHMGWTDRKNAIPVALHAARKALSLNPDEPWAHAALGYALIWKQPEEAIASLRQALALNPNFAVGHYYLALAATYAGHRDGVFAHADAAERLAPRDLLARGYDGAADNVRATASFAIGNYLDGAKFARKAILRTPNSPTGYRALTMNLALAGEVEEARASLQSIKRLAPGMSQSWIAMNAVWACAEEMVRYVEAFRLAGLT